MYRTKKKILPTFLALIYFCSASFVQIGHLHYVSGGSGSPHQIQSHDCGKNERHKPIGSEQHCVLCQQIHQFVSTLAPVFPATAIQERLLTFPTLVFPHFQEAHFYSVSRGPPALM